MPELLSDPQLEVTALQEVQELCQHCLKYLSPDSGLSHNLAQIEIRVLWVLRHHPLSRMDHSTLTARQDQLRGLLSGQAGATRQ
jgi:hypothetical protein